MHDFKSILFFDVSKNFLIWCFDFLKRDKQEWENYIMEEGFIRFFVVLFLSEILLPALWAFSLTSKLRFTHRTGYSDLVHGY